jgi:hypothetical protein
VSPFCTKLCVCVSQNSNAVEPSRQDQHEIVDRWVPFLKHALQNSSNYRLQNDKMLIQVRERQIGNFFIIAFLLILDSGHQVCAQLFVSHLDHEMRQIVGEQIAQIIKEYDQDLTHITLPAEIGRLQQGACFGWEELKAAKSQSSKAQAAS